MLARIEHISQIAAVLAVAAFFSLGTYVLWQARGIPLHVNGVLTRAEGVIASADGTISKVDSAIDAQTASCAGDGPCKSLVGNLNKTAVKIQDIAVTTQLQVKQTDKLVTAASGAITSSADHLNKTADAATELTVQATLDLKTLNGSIEATQPLLAQSQATVGDLDALLKDEALKRTLSNVDAMTWNANGILADAHQVSDKLTADYLKPKPWYRKVTGRIGDVIDISAAVARQVP